MYNKKEYVELMVEEFDRTVEEAEHEAEIREKLIEEIMAYGKFRTYTREDAENVVDYLEEPLEYAVMTEEDALVTYAFSFSAQPQTLDNLGDGKDYFLFEGNVYGWEEGNPDTLEKVADSLDEYNDMYKKVWDGILN